MCDRTGDPMTGQHHDNDLESLVARVIAGDRVAFGALVEHTQRVTYPLALRLVRSQADAEDVLQEAYLRVWQGLSGVRDPGAALGWICRIVRNVAIDKVRRQRRRKAESLDRDRGDGMGALVEHIASDAPSPHDELASAQVSAAMRGIVDDLKEKHRVVLLLREVDGMSYEDIAAALGIPIGTVESRLFRARKELVVKVERLSRAQAKESA
jgi:RNA polymerase sigma-70 factor (ECF subfamily)